MFKNGEFDGFGRYEDLNVHTIYEGNFSEGLRDGFGKEYGSNKDHQFIEYEGHWKDGKKDGKGKQKSKNSSQSDISFIEGKWLNNILVDTIQEVQGSKQTIRDANQNNFSTVLGTIKELQDDHLKQQDLIKDQIQELTKKNKTI